MEAICLFIEAPIAAFRPNWSREYQDTYPFPPPATVYGMLLSLVGVDWPEKEKHAGVQLALAIQEDPERGRVFRKLRRVPQANLNADPLTARRPDYQDLLFWLKVWVWLADGQAQNSLTEAVRKALNPRTRGSIVRYGGLSLGESSHLVNDVRLIDHPEGTARFLTHDDHGFLNLPTWVAHPRCGERQTAVERFSLSDPLSLARPPEDDRRWIAVRPLRIGNCRDLTKPLERDKP